MCSLFPSLSCSSHIPAVFSRTCTSYSAQFRYNRIRLAMKKPPCATTFWILCTDRVVGTPSTAAPTRFPRIPTTCLESHSRTPKHLPRFLRSLWHSLLAKSGVHDDRSKCVYIRQSTSLWSVEDKHGLSAGLVAYCGIPTKWPPIINLSPKIAKTLDRWPSMCINTILVREDNEASLSTVTWTALRPPTINTSWPLGIDGLAASTDKRGVS